MTSTPLSSITLHFDYDLVAARRRARQIAALLGYEEQDQTRIATVVSEIARNALRYAGGGRVEFGVDNRDGMDSLTITITDRGPGIPNLDEVLSGRYESRTGMGIGLTGARRLMDDLQINTAPGKGTTVVMRKRLPETAPVLTGAKLNELMDALARQRPESPLEEIQQQNGELLQALGQLKERQEELQRLNQELEDTNRGVLALYAELDEKAEAVRHADRMKSRFLSDMSHEFRTPVNAILALTRLLNEGPLDAEGQKQVALIRRAAEDMESLVNDLLDLAKIEAGKIEVRATEFEVTNLFSALRGMLRPLLLNRSLSLVFDDVDGMVMLSDEGKISQILRNFISNALKYTESGEIRVSAAATRESIRFSVADTGIGIAPEDQERVFEDFTQLDNPLQSTHKGTGLGLPLVLKLANLLGGTVDVRSTIGIGSTFSAEIPIRYPGAEPPPPPPTPLRLLIIDDDETARYTLSSFAARPGTQIVEAENGLQGLARAAEDRFDLIMLDLMMPGIGGHEVLARLKGDPTTADIPVVIVTSRFVNDEERKQILSRAVSVIYKGDLSRETVTRAINEALGK